MNVSSGQTLLRVVWSIKSYSIMFTVYEKNKDDKMVQQLVSAIDVKTWLRC